MSTKAKKAAAKSAPAKAAKAAPAAAKAGKKSAAKAAPTAKAIELKEGDAPQVDPDELEEQEDAAAAASSSAGGNAAAIAAAGGSTEMSASFKNFRHHPDMENFYRFIYENDLRHEALAIIDDIMVEKMKRRQMKMAKAGAH